MTITDEMCRALVAEWRRHFPGAGWPSLETARELLTAALAVARPKDAA
jgi:hypothetical protein